MSTMPTAKMIVRTRPCPTIVVRQDGYDMGTQR